VSKIKAVVAELPTYGYRRVHAVLKRQAAFENLRYQRLLAQEPMKFANLVLQSPIIRSRHDLRHGVKKTTAAAAVARRRTVPDEDRGRFGGRTRPLSYSAVNRSYRDGQG